METFVLLPIHFEDDVAPTLSGVFNEARPLVPGERIKVQDRSREGFAECEIVRVEGQVLYVRRLAH